jgi:hypothetical protein
MFTYNNDLKQGLADVGIDFYKVVDYLGTDTHGKPLTGRSIALNTREARKSNPYLFVNRLDNGGFLYVGGNHAGGKYTYNTNDDNTFTAPQFIPQSKPNKDDSWRRNSFDNALKEWKKADGIAATHPYIVKSGLSFDGLIDIRRANFVSVNSGKRFTSNFDANTRDGFDFIDCIAFQLFDASGKIKAFQLIDSRGAKYLVGPKKGAFAVIGGDIASLHSGAAVAEGFKTALSIYHAAGNGSTTISNPMKLPVVVAVDAGNLTNVFEALTNQFKESKFELYADNDHDAKDLPKGNTGRFYAVELCEKFGLSGYYLPVGDDGSLNVKADFDDTLHFKRIDAPNRYESALERVRYCHKSRLEGMVAKAANVLSDYAAIEKVLRERGADTSLIDSLGTTKIDSEIDVEGVTRINIAGKTNADLVEELPINGVGLCDRRGMGGAKTEFMGMRMARQSTSSYITNRIALVGSSCGRIEEMVHYHEADSYDDHVGMCLNSLPRYLSSAIGKPVYLDEARQVLETLVSSPIIENRQELFDGFISVLNHCPSFHSADADFDNTAIEFYKRHAPHLKFIVLESEAVKHPARHIKLPSFNAAKKKLIDELLSGNRGVAAVSSKNQAQKIVKFVKKHAGDKRILLYTGQGKSEKQLKFAANPSVESQNYDLIVYTSAMGSGVSIVDHGLSFTISLISQILPSNENLQMIGRNRCAQRVYVAFDRCRNTHRETDIEVLKQGQMRKMHVFAANNGMAVSVVELTELGIMQCELMARVNADLNDFENAFLNLAKMRGRIFESESVTVSEEMKASIKAIDKETKAELMHEVLNAKRLDHVELVKLKNKPIHTQDESNSLKLAAVCEMVGSKTVELADVANLEKGYSKRIRNFMLIQSDSEALKELDRSSFEKASSMRSLSSRQKVIKKVLKPLVNTKDGLIGRKEIKAAHAQILKNYAELASDFGRISSDGIAPAKTIANFLDKFGLNFVSTKRTEKERFFTIKVDSEIVRYANNRAACSDFEKMTELFLTSLKDKKTSFVMLND